MGHGFDTARLDRIPAFLDAKYVGAGRLPHAATLVSRRGEIRSEEHTSELQSH